MLHVRVNYNVLYEKIVISRMLSAFTGAFELMAFSMEKYLVPSRALEVDRSFDF